MLPDALVLRPLDATERSYRRTIWAIAVGILAFATLQCLWALSIGSRQLLKDGLDWGYDVVLYGIAALVFGRGERLERASALGVGAIIGFAGLHTLYDLWDKIVAPRPIEMLTIGFSAASTVMIALLMLRALWPFRASENPLIQATWLSTRNAVIATGFFVTLTVTVRLAPVRWPEYALDLAFAALNFQATFKILRTEWRARREVGDAAALGA